MTVTRLIARPMLASMFVVGGVNALRNADALSAKAEPVTDKIVPLARKAVPQAPIPSDPTTLVRINGATQVLAGLALATGRAPRLSAGLLAATLVPTTAAAHLYWQESDPGARQAQKVHFLKNVSMLGGLLLAGVDTDGRPGVAWRARRAARDVRREARTLARSARQEAKLVRAQIA